MRFETNGFAQEPVAVLEDEILRLKAPDNSFWAVMMCAETVSAWASDEQSFSDAIDNGGRQFFPGDTLTIRF